MATATLIKKNLLGLAYSFMGLVQCRLVLKRELRVLYFDLQAAGDCATLGVA